MRSEALPHAVRRLRYDTRGATITEYALMLFLLAVVAAGGLRVFGATVAGGMAGTTSNLKSSDPPPKTEDPGSNEAMGGGAHTTLRTSHGAKGGGGGGGTEVAEGFGGPRVRTVAKEESPLAKFAMIALGVIGAAAAFFAAMKGKHAR